jgi:probable rRNA maturation factor
VTSTVEVANRTRVAIDAGAVRAVVTAVLAAEGAAGAEVGVTFVGERRMRALNRDHRGRDEVTDVLSFPLEDTSEPGREAPEVWGGRPGDSDRAGGPPRLLGDVVVCARRALRQARAAGVPPGRELAELLVHGTLHLLGGDHETDGGPMLARQAALLATVPTEGLLVAAH